MRALFGFLLPAAACAVVVSPELRTGSLYPGPASKPAAEAAQWTLTFEDNFDGLVLNSSRWNTRQNESHCAPCEAELYIASRVKVSASNLVITTTRDHVVGPGGQIYNWTSGWVDTKGKFAQLYGLWEASVILPSQNATGIWPAFWTLPDSNDCWPTQGVSSERRQCVISLTFPGVVRFGSIVTESGVALLWVVWILLSPIGNILDKHA